MKRIFIKSPHDNKKIKESLAVDKDRTNLNRTLKKHPHEPWLWVCGSKLMKVCKSYYCSLWTRATCRFDMPKMMFLWSENDNEIYNAAFSHFGLSSPLQGCIIPASPWHTSYIPAGAKWETKAPMRNLISICKRNLKW